MIAYAHIRSLTEAEEYVARMVSACWPKSRRVELLDALRWHVTRVRERAEQVDACASVAGCSYILSVLDR